MILTKVSLTRLDLFYFLFVLLEGEKKIGVDYLNSYNNTSNILPFQNAFQKH